MYRILNWFSNTSAILLLDENGSCEQTFFFFYSLEQMNHELEEEVIEICYKIGIKGRRWRRQLYWDTKDYESNGGRNDVWWKSHGA